MNDQAPSMLQPFQQSDIIPQGKEQALLAEALGQFSTLESLNDDSESSMAQESLFLQSVMQSISDFKDSKKGGLQNEHRININFGGNDPQSGNQFKNNSYFSRLITAVEGKLFRANFILLENQGVSSRLAYQLLMLIEFMQMLFFVYYRVEVLNEFVPPETSGSTISILGNSQPTSSTTQNTTSTGGGRSTATNQEDDNSLTILTSRVDQYFAYLNFPLIGLKSQQLSSFLPTVFALNIALYFVITVVLFVSDSLFKTSRLNGGLKEGTRLMVRILSLILTLYMTILQLPMYLMFYQGFLCDEDPDDVYIIDSVTCIEPASGGNYHLTLVGVSVGTMLPFLLLVVIQTLTFTKRSFEYSSMVPQAQSDANSDFIALVLRLVLAGGFMFDKIGNARGYLNVLAGSICIFKAYLRVKGSTFYIDQGINLTSLFFEIALSWLFASMGIQAMANQSGEPNSYSGLITNFFAGIFIAVNFVIYLSKRVHKVLNNKKQNGKLVIQTLYQLLESKDSYSRLMYLQGYLLNHLESCTVKDNACICEQITEEVSSLKGIRDQLDRATLELNEESSQKFFPKKDSSHVNQDESISQPFILPSTGLESKIYGYSGIPPHQALVSQDIHPEESHTPAKFKGSYPKFQAFNEECKTASLMASGLELPLNKLEMKATGAFGSNFESISPSLLAKKVKHNSKAVNEEEDVSIYSNSQMFAGNKIKGKDSQEIYYDPKANHGDDIKMQMILMEEVESEESFEVSWFKFLSFMIDSSIQKESSSIGLRIVNSQIQRSKLGNKFKAIFDLMKCERQNPSLSQRFSIFQERVLIQLSLSNNAPQSGLNSSQNIHSSNQYLQNIKDIVLYDKMFLRYCILEYVTAHSALGFWKELLSKSIDSQALQKRGAEISQNYAKTRKIAEQLHKLKGSDIKFLFRYGCFLKNVMNNTFEALSIFEKGYTQYFLKTSDRTLQKQSNDVSVFCDNSATAIIMIAADPFQIGRILYSNTEVTHLLGFTPKTLLGHSLGMIMPGNFAVVHNRFIQRYLETAQEKVLNNMTQMPTINKEGYLQIVRSVIKVYPQISDKIIFTGFLQGCLTYDGFAHPSKFDHSELKDAHYICTDIKGNVKAVTKGLFFSMGLHSKFFSQKEDYSFELNLTLFNPDFQDQETDELLESEGTIMLIDTLDIMQFVDLESLSQNEIEDVKTRLCQLQAFVQMKRLNYGEPGHRTAVSMKLYKVCLLSEEYISKMNGLQFEGSGLEQSSAGVVNKDTVEPNSAVKKSGDGLLDQLASSSNQEDKGRQSIDHISKGGSLSSNVRYFKKVVKDFKEDLAERQIPRSLLMLNRALIILCLIVVSLASAEYIIKVDTVTAYQEYHERGLSAEVRYVTLVQLTSNIRSLVNIANNLETNSYEGKDLAQLRRFDYLSGLIQEQADALQATHDFLSQSRQQGGFSDEQEALEQEPVVLYRVDMNNQVYKLYLQYRVGLNTYLNYIQMLNNTAQANLNMHLEVLKGSQMGNLTQVSTTPDQKNILYLLLNGLRSLRERSMLIVQKVVNKGDQPTFEMSLKSLCGLAIVFAFIQVALISWQITIHQRNKGDILSMYAERKVPDIKRIYLQTQGYVYRLLVQEGIIQPLQQPEESLQRDDTYASIAYTLVQEVKKPQNDSFESGLGNQNFNRKRNKMRRRRRYIPVEESFPGSLFYSPMVNEMLAFINQTLKRERIKELNQSQLADGGSSMRYDKEDLKSANPEENEVDEPSSKRELLERSLSVTEGILAKRAAKKQAKNKDRKNSSSEEEEGGNNSGDPRIISTVKQKKSHQLKEEKFEEQQQPMREEDILENRRKSIQGTLKNHNIWYHVSTWTVGCLVATYFLFANQYQAKFDTDVQNFLSVYPRLFDRYSDLMLSYVFAREKIMNNNTLESFYSPSNEFSPKDIDFYFKDRSLVTEASLANLKLKDTSSLAALIEFQKSSDSNQFCGFIIGEFKGQIEEKIVVTRNLEKKLKEIRRIAYQIEIQTIIAACNAASENRLDVIKLLNEKKIDLNNGDYDKRTPLHVACSSGNLDIVKYLVDVAMVNVNPIDRWGATPLCDALPHPEIRSFLESKGAFLGKIQPPYDGVPVTVTDDQFRLFYACFYGDLDMIENLRLIGWNVNGQDYDGRTALGIAASEGKLPVVKYLVGKGADLSIKDARGNDPLADATRENRTSTVQYLSGIINESLIRGFCSDYHEGLLKQGIQQAVGNFHKKLSDLQIQLAEPRNISYPHLLYLLNPNTTDNLAGTLPTFFSVQELYFTKAIQQLSTLITIANRSLTDEYLLSVKTALIIFLIYQIFVMVYLRGRLIKQVNDEVFQSRGILNLIPEEFFEDNPHTVERIMSKLVK